MSDKVCARCGRVHDPFDWEAARKRAIDRGVERIRDAILKDLVEASRQDQRSSDD